MSRIHLTALFLTLFSFLAFGQRPDTIPAIRQVDSVYQAGEDIPVWLDSIHRVGVTEVEIEDTLEVEEPDFSHSPSKAIMYALVLPGLGQGYNKKYFKIPIVWAALGAAGYAINFNTQMYHEWSRNYALTPDETSQRYLEYWRRNLELSYISLIVVYALQVVDAYVDAQLYSWDVNENLTMRVVPSIQPLLFSDITQPPRQAGSILKSSTGAFLNGRPSYGLTCSFNIKGR